jgi:hypothetical protein
MPESEAIRPAQRRISVLRAPRRKLQGVLPKTTAQVVFEAHLVPQPVQSGHSYSLLGLLRTDRKRVPDPTPAAERRHKIAQDVSPG